MAEVPKPGGEIKDVQLEIWMQQKREVTPSE